MLFLQILHLKSPAKVVKKSPGKIPSRSLSASEKIKPRTKKIYEKPLKEPVVREKGKKEEFIFADTLRVKGKILFEQADTLLCN